MTSSQTTELSAALAEISHTELTSFPVVIGLVAATLQTQRTSIKENQDLNRAIGSRDTA